MSRTYIINVCGVCGGPFKESEKIHLVQECVVTYTPLTTYNKRKLKDNEIRVIYTPGKKQPVHLTCYRLNH